MGPPTIQWTGLVPACTMEPARTLPSPKSLTEVEMLIPFPLTQLAYCFLFFFLNRVDISDKKKETHKAKIVGFFQISTII